MEQRHGNNGHTKKLPVVNQREFRIVGMSRSGNHAIINWILHQLDGRYLFLNCAEPKTNPFRSARPLSENDGVYKTNIPEFDLQQEREGRFALKDYLVYSYEDTFLGAMKHKDFEDHHDAFVGPSGERRDILILRDPYNLFASRMRSSVMDEDARDVRPISPQTEKRIYKQHAKEFLKPKHLRNPVCVNYNHWVESKSYRQFLANELALHFNDKGRFQVLGVAGGSSFDGVAYAGRANKMNVLERWKHFAEHPDYLQIFDEEVVTLAEQIFGDFPEIKEAPQAIGLTGS